MKLCCESSGKRLKIMAPSKVYFTDFRTKANGDGLPTKLKKLIKAA